MYSIIREGEINARVAELREAREAEDIRLRQALEQLAPLPPPAPDHSLESMSVSTDSTPQGLLAGDRSSKPHANAAASNTAFAVDHLHGLRDRVTPPAMERISRQVELLERQVAGMRLALVNCLDENRFLRLEIDVLRDAVLGGEESIAATKARGVLDIIGRRAGTQDLKDSVCSSCLTKTPCYACYACRSVEYCSSKCQIDDMPRHIALCRHITERNF